MTLERIEPPSPRLSHESPGGAASHINPPGKPAGRNSAKSSDATGAGAYTGPFWITYGANLALMMAIALLYRYADFVKFLGGDELLLGWVVGLGMVGSLFMRLVQGVGIDLYGVRRIWILSILGFIVSCLGHLLVERPDGPAIFFLRVLYNSSVAGFFGASITFISRRAPLSRIAEVVGTLGTSGFVGMVTGTMLGDWLFGTEEPTLVDLRRMFLVAAGLGGLSLVLSIWATRGLARPQRRKQPPLIWLLRRYHPGPVLATGVAMGFGLGLPSIFLRPYTEELGIERMAVFFAVYTGFAFAARMSTRRWPSTIGVRPMILIGLACLVMSVVLYLPVWSEWHLIWPALFLGAAHALLFPAVIADGSSSFPTRYRGLGTTLILSMFDLGTLFGYPLVGAILHFSEGLGLPKYPTMFLIVAAVLAAISLYYLWGTSGNRRARRASQPTGIATNGKLNGRPHVLPEAKSIMAPRPAGEPVIKSPTAIDARPA